ncbi:MAG: chitobiase/beta-hexosaminidase C-terminal domain-containing protein [Paludibacteraceae bacterium]|nr:chitobiase/beta-hexosaminidase C-terminal domain-containing protein [Paludibacteraceae bacterium]
MEQAGSYTSFVQLPQAGGTAYVRLAAADDADDEVTGSISITSAGATTKYITLTGEVIAAVTVTFNNNGTTTGAPAAIKLAQGGTLGSNLPGVGTMTAPITGYTFVGWVNHNDVWSGFESTLTQTLITGNETVNADVTYDAVWAKGSDDYKIVRSASELTSGNYVIDGYDDDTEVEEAMDNTFEGKAFPTEDHGVISTTDNSIIWNVTIENNKYALRNLSTNTYFNFTGSSSLTLSSALTYLTISGEVVDDLYEVDLNNGTKHLEYDNGKFDSWSSAYNTIYFYKQQISNYFVTTPNEYTVTWHKGNVGTATTPAFEGQTFADIAGAAPTVEDGDAGDCANKFMGWATSAITKDEATESDVQWAKDNTTPISGNVEYYAVFAQAEGTVAQTAAITPTDISGWTNMAYATSYNKTSADGTEWAMQGVWTNSSKVDNLQMNKQDGRAITTPEFASNITKIEFNAKGKDITIYDASGNEIKSQSLSSTADDYVIDMSDVEYNQVKIANKEEGTTNIYSLTITYGSTTYSNYVTQCTPVYDVKFYTDNGTTQYGETQSIEKNRYATAPDDPENDCSDFKGWSKTWEGDIVTVGEVQITEPTNFYAVWDAIKPVLDETYPKDNGATQGFEAADLKVIVSAPTAGTCLTYQWQMSTNATTGFTNIEGATASTYTPSTVEANTTYYRCVVTNGNKSTTSRVATFSVAPVTKCFAPSISIATGKAGFIRSTLVTLTTETEGATIYYTTDGTTTPSAETSQYTEPFTITDNTTIKAIAIKAEMTNSDVATATFYKAELQNVEVETAPAKVTYDALDTFDPAGLVITATYNYDLSEDVEYAGHEDKFEFSPNLETKLTVGDDKVTITWGEKTIDQKITVNCIAIDAPSVEVSKQGSTGITLTWSPIDNAVSYQVKWNGGEAEDATSPYVKTGLTDNTNYTYEVIAVGETNYCTSTTGVQNVKTNSKSCVSIDNAQIDKTPADFYVGESIEASQFKVDKHYDNGEIIKDNPSSITLPEGIANPLTNDAVGKQIVTLTFNHKTTTIEITVKPQPVVTWSINGNEDNKQSFAYNAALVLPEAPAAPQTCAEKTFVGWTTETYKDHDSDEAPEVLFTEAGDRKVTEDVTYYAVFAMVESSTITDDITLTTTGVSGTSYSAWENKQVSTNAIYAGRCAGGNDAIQLRNDATDTKPASGLISTTSGGKVTKVAVEWNDNTAGGRVLNVFASNTAYTDVADLTDDSKKGTLLGTIVEGTSTELVISGDYQYIGVRSNSGALYLDKVSIDWTNGSTTAYSTTCAARTPQSIAITHEATTKIFDVNDAFTYEGLEITATYDSGDPQVVTDYCTITAPDMTTAGEKDVNISYTENDVPVYTSYKINVRQPYYVMYDPNGATTGSAPSDTKKYYTDEKVTVLANESLVKTNNVFKGWSYAGTTYQAGEQVTVGTENITLTAVWEEKMPCTITLSENGNTSTVTDKFTGDNYTLPATITNNVDGYAFMGWSTQEIDDPVATTEQGTFFAKGEEITLINNAYTFYAVYARTSGTSSDYNAGKVTTSADIVAGGLYIFAIGDYAMNNTVESSAVQMTQNFAKTGLSSTDAIVFTLESATDGYYIKNSDGKYLHNGSGTGMSLINSTINTTAIWTFSYNTQQTSNAWQIQNAKNDNRFLGNPDASTHTIKAYATSNWATCPHAITIYRLVGGYTTAPTITVNGTTVQTVPANFHGNVIVENGGDVTLSAATTWKNLTIKNGGKVTTNAALTIKDLLIETKMGAGNGKVTSPNMKGASGQLIIGEGGSIAASGSAIIENQIDPTGTASEGWYTFSVPFPVNAQNGIYYGETKLVNGYDYAIMEYLGDVRAQGQYGWKKYSGILQPGKMYVIAVADTDYGKLRFKKTAEGDLVSANSWTAGIYGGGDDANWNAIGNPNLAISQFVNDGGVQTLQLYDHTTNAFTGYAKGELNIVVGSGFFIQAVEEKKNITMKVNETTSNRGYRAPAEEVEEKPFVAVQLLQGETMNDQVFLNADANASLSYEIGRDVAKIFMQGDAKCAQIYVPAYGTNLCAAQFPLNANNEALFPLTLTAPKKGAYTIAAENVPEGVNLFLEQDGALIWNLNNSAYEIYLNKGETNEYSIRLVANSPLAPTGSETIEAEDNAQKLIINSNFYIIKSGSVYSAQGQLVK